MIKLQQLLIEATQPTSLLQYVPIELAKKYPNKKEIFHKIKGNILQLSTVLDKNKNPYVRIDNKLKANSLQLRADVLNDKPALTIVAIASHPDNDMKGWGDMVIQTIIKLMTAKYHNDWVFGIEHNQNKTYWEHIYNKYNKVKFEEID